MLVRHLTNYILTVGLVGLRQITARTMDGKIDDGRRTGSKFIGKLCLALPYLACYAASACASSIEFGLPQLSFNSFI